MKKHDTAHWIRLYCRNIKLDEYFSAYKALLDEVKLNTPQRGKILEVGSGSGLSSLLLAHWGFNVVSLDIVPELIKFIKNRQEKFRTHFPIVRGDAFHLPFREDAFDTVFSEGLLEHYDEPFIVKGLREQRRVSKSCVVVDVPISPRYKKEWRYDEYLFSAEKWKRLIATSGLKIKSEYGRGGINPKYRSHRFIPGPLLRLIHLRRGPFAGFVCKNTL